PLKELGNSAAELDHLEPARDLPLCVAEHLAVLGGQEPGQVVLMLEQELAHAEEERRFLREGRRAPVGERRLRGLNSAVHLLDRREIHRAALAAGRRVVDGAGPAGFTGDGSTADPVTDPLDVLRLFGRRGRDFGHFVLPRGRSSVPLSRPGLQFCRGFRKLFPVAIVESNTELGRQVVEDAKQYVLHSWSVQDALQPIAVAGGEGRYFWDFDGKRYLDFASQLVNVSIGHQHPKVVAAIKEQADKLCTIGPPMATEPRSTLARMLAEITPGDLEMSFFTNGGAEANENAIKLARW